MARRRAIEKPVKAYEYREEPLSPWMPEPSDLEKLARSQDEHVYTTRPGAQLRPRGFEWKTRKLITTAGGLPAFLDLLPMEELGDTERRQQLLNANAQNKAAREALKAAKRGTKERWSPEITRLERNVEQAATVLDRHLHSLFHDYGFSPEAVDEIQEHAQFVKPAAYSGKMTRLTLPSESYTALKSRGITEADASSVIKQLEQKIESEMRAVEDWKKKRPLREELKALTVFEKSLKRLARARQEGGDRTLGTFKERNVKPMVRLFQRLGHRVETYQPRQTKEEVSMRREMTKAMIADRAARYGGSLAGKRLESRYRPLPHPGFRQTRRGIEERLPAAVGPRARARLREPLLAEPQVEPFTGQELTEADVLRILDHPSPAVMPIVELTLLRLIQAREETRDEYGQDEFPVYYGDRLQSLKIGNRDRRAIKGLAGWAGRYDAAKGTELLRKIQKASKFRDMEYRRFLSCFAQGMVRRYRKQMMHILRVEFANRGYYIRANPQEMGMYKRNPPGKIKRTYPAPAWVQEKYKQAAQAAHPLAPYKHLFSEHPSGTGGWMARIPAGQYELSVIAGGYYYSDPRSNKPDPLDYTQYEVGIMGSGGLTRPPESLKKIQAKSYETSLHGLFEGGNTPVAGYVDAEDIVAMIPALESPLHKLAQVAAESGYDPRGMLGQKTAKFVRQLSPTQTLWEVNPPMEGYSWGEEEGPKYGYVVASRGGMGPGWSETYFFGATPEGEITDWSELSASSGAPTDERELLVRAGYAIQNTSRRTRRPRRNRRK